MEKSSQTDGSQTEAGRYQLLIEAVTDYAIYMLDADGIVSSWNPGARRFKQYEAEEIIGQHFSVFYDVGDRASGLPERGLATARAEGKFESEGWRIRKDGTKFWAHVVIDPIKSATGKIVGYAKITRDLTERREAERELRKSQEQFEILVRGVTDYAIYMLDTQGLVTSWNAGAQRIKGYLPEEILGSHFSQFYTTADRDNDEPARALETAKREGKYEKEGLRVRKDGQEFWASVVIDALRNDHGELIGFAKITRDITERKNAEKALEVARENLFQSQKMDAIGQLTGGVAHDFNNLLAAVMGSLELARRRTGEDEKLGRLIDNALKAAQRGAVLTQRMLAFARRQELKPSAVDIVNLLSNMSGLLQSSLGPAIVIKTKLPANQKKVWADANQLELAILNICVNARDAMMPAGGEIVIEAKEEKVLLGLWAARYVRLSIIDRGEGMDGETLRRALEPFFTTKGVGKGTGAWAVDGPRHDGAAWRQAGIAERDGQGHDSHPAAAGC